MKASKLDETRRDDTGVEHKKEVVTKLPQMGNSLGFKNNRKKRRILEVGPRPGALEKGKNGARSRFKRESEFRKAFQSEGLGP